MKRNIFIVLFLAAWGVCVFAYARAEERNPVSRKHVTAWSNLQYCCVSTAAYHENAASNWYVTESGYVAAMEEELLDRAIFWAGFGDGNEFERFLDSSPLVFPLKGGLRVYVEKFSWCGKVRIRPEGSSISVWTVREAIRSAYPRNFF